MENLSEVKLMCLTKHKLVKGFVAYKRTSNVEMNEQLSNYEAIKAEYEDLKLKITTKSTSIAGSSDTVENVDNYKAPKSIDSSEDEGVPMGDEGETTWTSETINEQIKDDDNYSTSKEDESVEDEETDESDGEPMSVEPEIEKDQATMKIDKRKLNDNEIVEGDKIDEKELYPNKTPLKIRKGLIAELKAKVKETLKEKDVHVENVGQQKYSINKSVKEFMTGTFTHKYLLEHKKTVRGRKGAIVREAMQPKHVTLVINEVINLWKQLPGSTQANLKNLINKGLTIFFNSYSNKFKQKYGWNKGARPYRPPARAIAGPSCPRCGLSGHVPSRCTGSRD